MEKYCGMLERVGDLTGGQLVAPVDRDGNAQWVGSFRVATEIASIQIGNTTLKKPRCEDDLFQNLWPGREGCLYVWRQWRTPVLVGVKYSDGTKHLISTSYLRGSILQLATIFSFMYGLGGLIAGGILGGILGLETLAPYLGVLGGLAAVGWCWYSAFQFWKDYQEAKAD